MELRDRVHDQMGRVRDEFRQVVAMRSVADPRQFPPEECARAAQWVLDAFGEVGLGDLRLVPTTDGSQAESSSGGCTS